MEKQWQQDERNPEFPFLRKAWRRNISALWDQIWKKLNYKKRPLSSYLAGDEISQNLYDTSHDEMEFPSHMDDVFLYSKQPATIPAVEESIAYPDLDLLSVAAKKKPAKKPRRISRLSRGSPPLPLPAGIPAGNLPPRRFAWRYV